MMQFKNRDWYKCFKDELYKQPGVTPDMDVREAAEHVAQSNDFIAYQLNAIKIAEDYGIGRVTLPLFTDRTCQRDSYGFNVARLLSSLCEPEGQNLCSSRWETPSKTSTCSTYAVV